MRFWLTLHRKKLFLFVLGLSAVTTFSVLSGSLKPRAEIEWMDIIGEGGSALAIATWSLLILGSRPAGRVTNLLFMGLGAMFFALWYDALDEIVEFSDSLFVQNALESIAMPVGLALLTLGLYQWHKEQLAINKQLNKRERLIREHKHIDPLTQIGDIDYLKIQLYMLTKTPFTDDSPPKSNLCITMINISQFNNFSRTYGHRESDALLNKLAEVIVLNLRNGDVVCRYAGDHYCLVLPNTTLHQATQLAEAIKACTHNFAFRFLNEVNSHTIHINAQTIAWQGEDATHLLRRAYENLHTLKDCKAA